MHENRLEAIGEFIEKLLKGGHPLLWLFCLWQVWQLSKNGGWRKAFNNSGFLFLFAVLSLDFAIRVVHVGIGRTPATRYYLIEMLAVSLYAARAIAGISHRALVKVLIVVALVFGVQIYRPRKAKVYIKVFAEVVKKDPELSKFILGDEQRRMNYYAKTWDQALNDPKHLYVVSAATLGDIQKGHGVNGRKFNLISTSQDRKGREIYLYLGRYY